MNLEDVAKLSDVSRSTVSRVINNNPHVSESTRQRVQEVIRSVNYRPNIAARGLAAGRTRILGLVIPTGVTALFSDPYYPILIQGISVTCNALDHSVMLWIAEPEYERRMIRQLTNNGVVDGFIVAAAIEDDPIVNALHEAQIPFVTVGRYPRFDDVSYVDTDDRAGAFEGVTHLVRLGRRRIACITGPFNTMAAQERLDGYREALTRRQIKFDPALVVESDYTRAGGYSAMRRLLVQQPDALFASSDDMAVGALRAIREAGLRVPEDVAMVGFDDMPFAVQTEPPLTTVRQPIEQTGRLAAQILIDQISQPGEAVRRIMLPTELVIRKSCGLM
jgi:LacI family transcriptional regulator